MPVSRRLLVSGTIAAHLIGARGAWSQVTPGRQALYQATAIVTGTDMRQRPLGFRRCLLEVVVKLTGAPQLEGNPALVALADHAEELIASFSYIDPRAGILHHDDQGTYDRSYELTVRFDPTKVDAALAMLGLVAWQGKRPLLVPVILVRDREPAPFLLSTAAPRGSEMRQAIVRFGSEFGIGVHLPTEADLAEWSVGLIGFPAPLTGFDDGRALVAGTLSWSVHAMGWVGSWRMQSGDVEHEWGIGGVGFDAALGDMVRGAVMLAARTGTP